MSWDNKEKITSAFGSDIILEGMTSVPNLLLRYYSQIGITNSEMMLIIQLMRLQTSTNQLFPSLDVLAQCVAGEKSHIKADLASLMEKGIICINHTYCEESNDIVARYSYEPLFEKVLEIWACEKVKACQQMKKNLKQPKKDRVGKDKAGHPAFARVCQAFEKEFGKLLSPMEIEWVNSWLDDNGGQPELIMEALKRAVIMGKLNFRYIDTILLEWQKNKLKTVADVQKHEAGFRERQVSRVVKRKAQEDDKKTNKKPDKFRLLYLG